MKKTRDETFVERLAGNGARHRDLVMVTVSQNGPRLGIAPTCAALGCPGPPTTVDVGLGGPRRGGGARRVCLLWTSSCGRTPQA